VKLMDRWQVMEKDPRSDLYSIVRGSSRFRLIAKLHYLYHKHVKKRNVKLFKLTYEILEEGKMRVPSKLLYWLSGLWGGILVGALVACPEKHVSIPFSIALMVILAVLGGRQEKKGC